MCLHVPSSWVIRVRVQRGQTSWNTAMITETQIEAMPTLTQPAIQLVEVDYLGHGRGPLALQIEHTVLNPWLLRSRGRQTELRTEGVVRGQSRVAGMQR